MIDDFIQFVREIYHTDEFIPLHAPIFSSLDKELVIDAIDSTFVSSVSDYVTNSNNSLVNLLELVM